MERKLNDLEMSIDMLKLTDRPEWEAMVQWVVENLDTLRDDAIDRPHSEAEMAFIRGQVDILRQVQDIRDHYMEVYRAQTE